MQSQVFEVTDLNPTKSIESSTYHDYFREIIIEVTTGTAIDAQQIIQKEKRAFEMMRKKLLADPTYTGKYVAIHDGQIIDVDDDWSTLARRVYDKLDYIPILIEKIVQDEIKVRLGRPRFEIK